jgi:hypothetical protein
MLIKYTVILSAIIAYMLAFPAANVNAATTVNSTTLAPTEAANIKDFGAHSITETGYETFDSSVAINKAIQYAKTNNISSVDFGSGKYYAKDISLESNITYFSTSDAELIASPDTKLWHSVLSATNKENITIKGLTINGNKDVVPGNTSQGSPLISLSTSNEVSINNCYLYNNQYLGILIQNNCNYLNIKNNKIYDTDCGIMSAHAASSNLLIDGNTIYGSKENQFSEPIAIFNANTNGLAHDITITNNTVHDKLNASGIFVVNSTKVLIKGNTVYNTCTGINIGVDGGMSGDKVSASSDITITENNIYNCSGGITGELKNSLVSKNTLNNLNGTGIWLLTKNVLSPISNDTITDNTITNINSLGDQEPAIRLENTSDCIIDKNNVSDTRSTPVHWFVIQIAGGKSTNNIVQNNTNLGATAKGGYQIYIQNANNTTVQNNTATILDQGKETKLINNIAK